MGNWVWWVLAAGLLLVSIVMLLAMRGRRVDMASLSQSERELHGRIVAADQAVKAAQRAHRKAVKKAGMAVKEAQHVPKVASVEGVQITALEAKFGTSIHQLSPDTHFDLNSDGTISAVATSRTTLTRLTTGAALGGAQGAIAGAIAKKGKVENVDTREVFLVITDPEWAEVVKVDGGQKQAALEVVAKGSVAAAKSQAFREGREHRIREATDHLEAVKADRSAIERAVRERECLGSDPLRELRIRGKVAQGD